MARVTMVKKRLANGELCKKCQQAEDMLKRRGLWDQIDEVVWADEREEDSPGMGLAARYGVDLAPFFLIDRDGEVAVETSAMKLVKNVLQNAGPQAAAPPAEGSLTQQEVENTDFSGQEPERIVDFVLKRLGADCVLAFSGAEDVALIDMAAKSGHPFSVFSLDTGRLHPETYRFIERVRKHYGIEIRMQSPDFVALEDLVRRKGLFSFYEDGHAECCGIRKVEPLKRALARHKGWITGQRRDQSPTRTDVPELIWDTAHVPRGLVKANPLANWSLARVWQYIRENDVPYNELHDRGFVSIGCEPCTRAIRPTEHERAGRWWWEENTKRECGLHR